MDSCQLLGRMTLPELIELLRILADDLELWTMEWTGEMACCRRSGSGGRSMKTTLQLESGNMEQAETNNDMG